MARSVDIDLYQMTFTKDSAYPFLIELGTNAKHLQFIDINKNEQVFKLPFAKQLNSSEESLRQLK